MNDQHFSTKAEPVSNFACSRRHVLGVLGALMPAVLLAPLTGCAWKPEIVHADPSLSSKDLVQGRMVILPVKFDTDKFKPQERAFCGQLFLRAVQQNRGDIPLVSTPKLNDAMNGSIEAEAEMLKFYDKGAMDANAIASFGQAIGARYLVLTRLSYDQRAVGGGGRMANSTTESTLNGDVSILDTTTGNVVWQGTFSSTKSGIDTVVDPSPSKHGLPFFSTFVNAWPAPTA